jgi:hypothetical protein
MCMRGRLTCPATQKNAAYSQHDAEQLANRAWTPHASQAFSDLAETWRKLAADAALFAALLEMDFGEPYEALPRALSLLSRAA